MKKIFYLVILFSTLILSSYGQKSFFKQVEGVQSLATAPMDLGTKNVQKFKLYDWDDANIKAYLATAPNDQLKNQSGISFDLPLADGSFETFIVKESPISTPEYMASHPNQRFFEGYSTKNKTVMTRFGYTENGFHAIILGLKETQFLTPTPGNQVMAYKVSDAKKSDNSIPTSYCGVDKKSDRIPIDVQKLTLSPDQITASSGDMLRTYRAAFLVNNEFTAAAGGKSAASGWISVYVNQMIAIYKRDLSITFTLIGNNDNLIFSPPPIGVASSPVGNATTSEMSDRGSIVIDSVIGTANYDIGHVIGKTVSTGDGIASKGGVCLTTSANSGKGDAASRIGDSFNDIFALSLVLHEAGHQFGCSHSFNGTVGACTTRAAATAVEPGAGVTLMSYAATCTSAQDIGSPILQFHTINFDQVFTTISAAGCPAPFSTTATSNTAPTVTGSANYTIPKSTPFTLTGSATDAQGDALTYVWEEVDAGTTAGNPASTYAPFFRSFAPDAAGNVRTFPSMTGILNGTNATLGEILPSVATTMNFRLVARDNNAAGGGVAYAATNTIITVDATGPFLITSDPTGTLNGNSPQTITWSFNGTGFTGSNKDGVGFRSVTGATNVKISLSTDGGTTFPTVLLASTLNNGSASVTLPNITTTTARIKVEAIGNIFFDVSNFNFSINAVTPVNWLDFIATLDKANNANLVWRTASEQNNKGYTIEMSSDGTNFEAIGEVKGAGTVSTESKYTFVKALETPDRYYFRIKQEDYNGKIEYSKIVSVSLKGSFDAKFYPNPAKDELNLDLYTATNDNFSIEIVNAIGQIVLQLPKSNYDEGHHTIKINTSSLNEGIYFYNLHSNDKVQNGKIVIGR